MDIEKEINKTKDAIINLSINALNDIIAKGELSAKYANMEEQGKKLLEKLEYLENIKKEENK